MNRDILITVILPVFNGEKYLVEAIESILNQTYENFEFIIINDGSKDGTLEIIEKYKKQDSRILLISRENRGLVESLNEGLGLAKGKYIARMDADDISERSRFENQLEIMENNKLDVVGSHFIVIDDDGVKQQAVFMPIKEELISLQFLDTVPVAHPSVMINREFLLKHKLSYKDISTEDYYLWSEMYRLGAKFSNCDDFLFYYRNNSNSFSRSKQKEMKKDKKIIINNFFGKNKESIFESIKLISLKYENYTAYEKDIFIKAISYIVIKKYYFSNIRKYIKFLRVKDFYKILSYLKSIS